MAKEIIVNVKANTKEAEGNIEELNEDLKETSQDLSAIDDAGDKMTGGLVSGFKSSLTAVKNFGKSLLTINGIMKASLFGVIALAITSVATALTNSEEGQNKFSRFLTQIKVIIGNVTDILGNFGDVILNVVSLNFDEAAKSIEKVTEGIKNFGEETAKEIKIAGELSDMRAKADKAERELIVSRAKADRDRADLLEKAVDREKFTVQERIGFLEEAAALEEKITNREIAAARLRLEAIRLENSLSESTKEDLEAEAQLEANLIQLETAKLTKQKEVTSQTIALKNEEAAALKAIEDQKIADEKERQEAKDAEDKRLAEEEKKREEEKAQAIIKFNESIQKAIKEQADAEILAQQRKKEAIENAIGQIAGIVGSNSKFGKGIAIVQAIRDTYAGANKALAQGGIFGFISAAAIISAGLANVKTITATQDPATPSFASSSGSTGAVSVPTPQAPAFNIVGSDPQNQLAQTLAETTAKPVKAFVVSSDVSTAQSLDRNIIEESSLG